MSRSSEYDAFAWFYDRYWADIFADTALFALEALLLPQVPVHGQLLDVCCGTGQVASELAARGYGVTGLDLSAAMLAHARRRSGEVAWLRADVRSFCLRPRYHGALAVFDSLNHLLTAADLTAALANVRAALQPEGLFLFDLNGEEGFRQRWVRDYRVETADGECHLRGEYDARQRLGRYRFTLRGRGDEAWRHADFDFYERCHTEAEVRAALAASGFAEVELCDAVADLGIEDEVGRVFYLASAV